MPAGRSATHRGVGAVAGDHCADCCGEYHGEAMANARRARGSGTADRTAGRLAVNSGGHSPGSAADNDAIQHDFAEALSALRAQDPSSA